MQQLQVVDRLGQAAARLPGAGRVDAQGQVSGAAGLSLEISGLNRLLAIGDRVMLKGRQPVPTLAEIVGFHSGRARAMPLGPLEGIGPGARATLPMGPGHAGLPVADGWLGRVVDALGAPLDGRGALPRGTPRPIRAAPPPAASRARLGPRISLGVRALDLFTTCQAAARPGTW